MSQSRAHKQQLRNYRNEYDSYQSQPNQIHNRSLRNHARLVESKKGLVSKGDGFDVDHKTPLMRGGSNNPSNFRVRSASSNRSFARTKRAGIK